MTRLSAMAILACTFALASIAGVFAPAPLGCATTKATIAADTKVMTGAFATCAKADLGQIVTGGLTLLGDVATIIVGNPATLEADLATLMGMVGLDGVKCAIAAVDAVLTPPPGTMAASNVAARLPGLARAIAWSQAQAQTATAAPAGIGRVQPGSAP